MLSANMVDEQLHPFSCPGCGLRMRAQVRCSLLARAREEGHPEGHCCDITQWVNYRSERYALRMEQVQNILDTFGVAKEVVTDAFADASNRRFESWMNEEMNSLEQDWKGRVMWCNPPWTLWPTATEKILKREADCICVCPWWSTKWLSRLMRVAVKNVFFARGFRLFELDGVPCGGIRWAVIVLFIPAMGQQSNEYPYWRKYPWSGSQRRKYKRQLVKDEE